MTPHLLAMSNGARDTLQHQIQSLAIARLVVVEGDLPFLWPRRRGALVWDDPVGLQ